MSDKKKKIEKPKTSPVTSSDFHTCIESWLTLKVIHYDAMVAILNMLVYSFSTKMI